ncbi:hypothetical protein CIW48_03410 [Methylobacterium sp. P1-11]|uniref:hypothetical protein n=1 Tax=Methylobacterium sp. P1-11 TaxID=2024616 RepID=UPI0011EC0F9D|nr:hypothetical protein [Methylobacterium sp. P1-11]KAA0125383.1 hypothetical protein CIW48_03410 [Methylobacterium sp. P1-11]
MGSSDPDTRRRQLARLRAAYEAHPGRPDPTAIGSGARHSRALLGRILVVLGGLPDGSGLPAVRPSGNGRARP